MHRVLYLTITRDLKERKSVSDCVFSFEYHSAWLCTLEPLFLLTLVSGCAWVLYCVCVLCRTLTSLWSSLLYHWWNVNRRVCCNVCSHTQAAHRTSHEHHIMASRCPRPRDTKTEHRRLFIMLFIHVPSLTPAVDKAFERNCEDLCWRLWINMNST